MKVTTITVGNIQYMGHPVNLDCSDGSKVTVTTKGQKLSRHLPTEIKSYKGTSDFGNECFIECRRVFDGAGNTVTEIYTVETATEKKILDVARHTEYERAAEEHRNVLRQALRDTVFAFKRTCETFESLIEDPRTEAYVEDITRMLNGVAGGLPMIRVAQSAKDAAISQQKADEIHLEADQSLLEEKIEI